MKYDYIIVGAGVVGCATARYLKLSDTGSNILLIDDHNRVGAGNTAKSAALYRNIFSSPTSRQLATGSIAYYETLGDEIQLNPIGYLWLFSDSQWERSKGARDSLDPERDRIEFIESAGLKDMLNINLRSHDEDARFPGIAYGILGHRCGSLSGMALAEHYAREFESLGGRIMLNARISGIELTGKETCYAPWDDVRSKGVKLKCGGDRTGNGRRSRNGDRGRCGIGDGNLSLRADHVVMATGAWTNELLHKVGIAGNVLPKKRQLFGLKIKDPRQIASIAGNDPAHGFPGTPAIILPAGGVYIKTLLDRNFLMVGCADDLGRPYELHDDGPDQGYFQKAIAPVLDHYFPDLKDYTLITSWAGHYAYHWPDKNPVLERVKNITWVSGTSGSGIMKADALGRIAAAHLRGKKIAQLADGTHFNVQDISLRNRKVENESFII